jgi:BASS family bile acid:Na+ symporter
MAKGNVPVAVGLMAILAGSSALIAPILLRLLAPMLAGNEPLVIDSTKIAGTLVATQLLPLSIGVAVRHWRPGWAEKLQKPATLVSKVLNLVIVGLILIVQFHVLSEIGLRAFGGMLALLFISWAAGWFLGGAELAARKAMTLTTALRNVGVGLVIATGSFAGTPVVTATLVYGLFGVFGSLLLAMALGRLSLAMNGNAENRPSVVASAAANAELK